MPPKDEQEPQKTEAPGKSDGDGCGCGCLILVLAVFLLWSCSFASNTDLQAANERIDKLESQIEVLMEAHPELPEGGGYQP